MLTTATASVSAAAPVSMLPLKVTLPLAGANVLRPELRAMLSEARLYPITLVIAPAGYGKTTLLVQWAHELIRTGAAVAWLGLDNGDRDAATLLTYLISAFSRMRETTSLSAIGGEAWRILHSAADPSQDWPIVAGALLSDLQANLSAPTFLFIDDLHAVTDAPQAGQVLSFLLRAAPPNLHIVLASRRVPSLVPLPRLRAEGNLIEISQQDLRLSTEQTAAVLERQGVKLTDTDLAQLVERTEGWALSVQLAARVLARHRTDQRASIVRALVEGQTDLFAYLASDVLADLPTQVVDFLYLAAIPSYFDTRLLVEASGSDQVPGLLERAQELGLAFLPIDEERETLRLHPLWRTLLLRDAPSHLGAERWSRYQRAFGRAFEGRNELEQALAHYAEAGANAELARALRAYAWPLLNSPRRSTIRQWLTRLPDEQRAADPELLHMWAWAQTGSAPQEAAEALSRAADGYLAQGQYDRELRALSDLAALLFWQDRAAEFDATCGRAIRAAKRVRDDWAKGATLVAVVALRYIRGQYQQALRVARRAAKHPLNPFWQWLMAMIVGSINVQLGRPTSALSAINAALTLPQIDRDDRLRQNLLRLRALALYEQGRPSDALSLALEAHQHLSDYYQDGSASVSALMLALLLAEQGRREEALTYLSQARSAANTMASAMLLARVAALEVHMQRLNGQAKEAAKAAPDAWRHLEQIEGDAPDLWFRLLLLVAMGEGGETKEAFAASQSLTVAMGERGYSLFLVAAQLYRATLAERSRDLAQRDAALQLGWTLLEAGEDHYIPVLPPPVLREAVAGALRQGLATQVVAEVLRRQLPDQATGLLVELLNESDAGVRIRASHLLGDLGAATAYPALRALLKDRTPEVRQAAEAALDRLVYLPPYRLRVRTLGVFSVWRGDSEVRDRDWRSIKARQLLQLLLIERGRLIPRDRVLDSLWPELDSDAAANNLRVTLSRLYKALEPERPDGAPSYYIQQHGDSYGFNVASNYAIDAAEFSDAVAAGQQAEQQRAHEQAVSAYRLAISLYNGPFLPDSLYEDWSVIERERLGLLFNLAALRLSELLLNDGHVHEAMGLAWRVLEYDEAHEESYRLLMRAHAQIGERSTALRLYQRCVKVLNEELGVDPLPETVALYEALRSSGDRQ